MSAVTTGIPHAVGASASILDRVTGHIGSLVVVAGVHAVGKSHLLRGIEASTTAAPLSVEGLSEWHTYKKTEALIERVARGPVKRAILHLGIYGGTDSHDGRDFSALAEIFASAAELRCLTLVAPRRLVIERLRERRARPQDGPRQRPSRDPAELYPNNASMARHYDAWFAFARPFAPVEHVIVDSAGPGIRVLPLSAWEQDIKPSWLLEDASVSHAPS